MKIGIIVFSRTGHTLHAAEKLKEVCLGQGHTVTIERVTAMNEDPQSQAPVKLKTVPNPTVYDAVFFGAPVQGFSLSPIMRAYLSQMPQFGRQKVACFLTQSFPMPWMGGNSALKQMLQLCMSKSAAVTETGIINWSKQSREKQIADIAARFSAI